MDFTGSFVVCDLKMGDTDNLLSLGSYVRIEGHGHFLTLAKGCLHACNLK